MEAVTGMTAISAVAWKQSHTELAVGAIGADALCGKDRSAPADAFHELDSGPDRPDLTGCRLRELKEELTRCLQRLRWKRGRLTWFETKGGIAVMVESRWRRLGVRRGCWYTRGREAGGTEKGGPSG